MNKSFQRHPSVKLIYENYNVTKENPLKKLFELLLQLSIILGVIYFLVFTTSGIIIKNMSNEQQIVLEEVLATQTKVKAISKLDKDIEERLEKIKNSIVAWDTTYPSRSSQKIKLVASKHLNAFCLPNGDIYITTKLYDKLTDDEALTFVVAHEMGHYKNRDHLMRLRKNLATGAIMAILIIANPDAESFSNFLESGIDVAGMKNSRFKEFRADRYAGNALIGIYGTTDGAIKALEILDSESNSYDFDILSTHPATERRIKQIKKLNTSVDSK